MDGGSERRDPNLPCSQLPWDRFLTANAQQQPLMNPVNQSDAQRQFVQQLKAELKCVDVVRYLSRIAQIAPCS